jgi:hypothetical protein
MDEPAFIRVDLGQEYLRPKMANLFRKALHKNDLFGEGFLYHAFDGLAAIDLVHMIGCDTNDPKAYSCGIAEGLKPKSQLYNPLDTAVMMEKPGLLVYRRRSLVAIDSDAAIYRFRGKNYFRALVAILLAKRPRVPRRSELHPDL